MRNWAHRMCCLFFLFHFFFNLSSSLIFPFPYLPSPSWVVRIYVTLISLGTSHWKGCWKAVEMFGFKEERLVKVQSYIEKRTCRWALNLLVSWCCRWPWSTAHLWQVVLLVVAMKMDYDATTVVIPTRICAGSTVEEAYLERDSLLGYH